MPSSDRWRPQFAVRLSILTLSLCADAASADPAPPYAVLVQQAQGAPRLAEAEAAVVQAQGLARQAGARPNPTVAVEVENFAGSGPFRGFDGVETTAFVEQALELGGKRPARIAAGRAEVAAAQARGAQTRSDFAFDLAEAYAQAEASDRRVELALETLALARDDARVADALVQAGKEADLRSVQARAAIQAARAEVDQARAARATAFAKLTAMAGASAPYTSLSGSLLSHADRTETPSAPDPLSSPVYLAAQASREAAARRIRVEQTRANPDVTLSLGVRRLSEENASAMVGGVSVPFPLFDRNRGNIDASQAELRAAEARLNAARLDAQAEAASGVARAQASQSRILAARDGEAAAEEAYRLTRLGYEGGKLPLSELLSARRALAEARTQTLNARLERLSAEAALARLQGAIPFGDR